MSKQYLKFVQERFSAFSSLKRGSFFQYQQVSHNLKSLSHFKKDHEDERYKNTHTSSDNYFGLLLPLCVIIAQKFKNNSNLLGTDDTRDFMKDELADRATSTQYPSNNPIEDRCTVSQLKSIPGYVAIVLDGHGGWQVGIDMVIL